MNSEILFTAKVKPIYRRLQWVTGVFLIGVAIYTIVDFTTTAEIGRIALLSSPILIIGLMVILRAVRLKVIVYDDRIEQCGIRRRTIVYDQVRSVFLNQNRIDVKSGFGTTISVSKEMEFRMEIRSYLMSRLIERSGVRIWGDTALIDRIKELYGSSG